MKNQQNLIVYNKQWLSWLFCLIAYFLSTTNALASSPFTKKYISYSDFGQGEALVLIHPLPADKTVWLPQQEGLKQHFRVISLDLWGFGYSEGTSGLAVTMDEYADQIAQLLDKLAIKKAIIAGESGRRLCCPNFSC